MHQCKTGDTPSPAPWRIVRSPTPFYSWIMDSSGGCVALGFGRSDEALLLAAPLLLAACESFVATYLRDTPEAVIAAYQQAYAAIAAAKGEQ